MRFVFEIDYDPARMEQSRRRLEARVRYEVVDCVPVGFCLVPRYFMLLFGLPYCALFESVEEHYRLQMAFLKYRLERIPEDLVCTGPALWVAPYFDNVLDSASFGAQVIWPENETLHCRPVIDTLEQMNTWPMPEPGTGLWGRSAEWCRAMRELAAETRLTIGGVEARVQVGGMSIGGLSPHMIAVDLVGEQFYAWQAEYPTECERFLGRITDALIAAQLHFMALDGRTNGGLNCLAEDTATAMSPAMFRRFCVPFAARLFEALGTGARGVHMCGPSTHLHEALRDDLRITSLDLFGYVVDPEDAARNLGGRALLWGNLNPMLLLAGSRDEVKAAALRALEAMAPCGGLMLGDGANVCPGTPLENLAAVTEAAAEYGLPPAFSTPSSPRSCADRPC